MNGVHYLSEAFHHFENSLKSAVGLLGLSQLHQRALCWAVFLFTFSGCTVYHSNRQSLLDIIPPIVSVLETEIKLTEQLLV